MLSYVPSKCCRYEKMNNKCKDVVRVLVPQAIKSLIFYVNIFLFLKAGFIFNSDILYYVCKNISHCLHMSCEWKQGILRKKRTPYRSLNGRSHLQSESRFRKRRLVALVLSIYVESNICTYVKRLIKQYTHK